MLKILIVVVMVLMIASLFSGLGFLLKDAGEQGARRTLHALGIRISLAVLLIALIVFGIWSGELTLNAPWHRPPG